MEATFGGNSPHPRTHDASGPSSTPSSQALLLDLCPNHAVLRAEKGLFVWGEAPPPPHPPLSAPSKKFPFTKQKDTPF